MTANHWMMMWPSHRWRAYHRSTTFGIQTYQENSMGNDDADFTSLEPIHWIYSLFADSICPRTRSWTQCPTAKTLTSSVMDCTTAFMLQSNIVAKYDFYAIFDCIRFHFVIDLCSCIITVFMGFVTISCVPTLRRSIKNHSFVISCQRWIARRPPSTGSGRQSKCICLDGKLHLYIAIDRNDALYKATTTTSTTTTTIAPPPTTSQAPERPLRRPDSRRPLRRRRPQHEYYYDDEDYDDDYVEERMTRRCVFFRFYNLFQNFAILNFHKKIAFFARGTP